MRVVVDDRFTQEVRALDFRFSCADCGHRSARTGRCAHDWPDDEHREPLLPPPGSPEVVVSFCKEFELV